MPGTNLTREEKVRILTLIEEKVPVNEIVRHTGRNKATIHRLKAVARDLPPASVPPAKPRSGCPHKTSKTTDALLQREVLKTPHITAAELQRNQPDILGNVAQRTIQHHLQKELHLPSPRKKTTSHGQNEEGSSCFCPQISTLDTRAVGKGDVE
ncbi:hypothetical protein Hamer_G000577 [Homarus americanus]|uniref:Transposase IS30-like HTH domain-containing protein n=1 Tax=Homarus americanus TaxID=6706 RepID=A0A8J5TLV9_HOMAM|nr:hypothetical protein Hamer_G000577 [Homarus americanus]